MAGTPNDYSSMPVVADIRAFDAKSGSGIERLIFNSRVVIILLCLALTALLGHQASKLQMNANFEKLLPQSHEYIQNYLEYQHELSGLGNTLQVVVENTAGEIFDAEYLYLLSKIHDELFLLPGTDRSFIKSLWAPLVRWQEVTEEGFDGGPVMPPTFDGSPQAVAELRENVSRAGLIGTLVADNLKSSMIVVPLIDVSPETGKPLDYRAYSAALEEIRSKYEQEADGKIKIHVTGYVQLVGDLISGLGQVVLFFAVALIMALGILYLYTRDVRSTLLLVICSLVGVVWQLGLVRLLGFNLDPYSVLVPFLIFAIGVSHGAQKMNGIMQDIGRGTHKYIAARYTFRRLFVAGITALAADVAGFAVLMLIDIPVIQELALAASIGVGMLVFTNLVLLPVLLSYIGVSRSAALRSIKNEEVEYSGGGLDRLWHFLECFTTRRWAASAIAVAVVIGMVGFIIAQNIQVGDLHDGAPELRPDSRYNLDNDFINAHFGQSSDVFAVMAVTPPNGCEAYETLIKADRLSWILQQDPAVQSTQSLATNVRRITMGQFENSPKWSTISSNSGLTNSALVRIQNSNPDLMNPTCSVFPIVSYLADHKAETLSRVLGAVEVFAAENNDDDIQFLPAAGSAGINAVTNIVVYDWNRKLLLLVYIAVALLSFMTFRSWRAVLVALLPLMLTSILCEALMVMLDIGLKVATLPVVALGVGIGIDYALYLLSMQLAFQRIGLPLKQAYRKALGFTGKVVALIGVTLSAGVVTWAWSPIKFQADMGILLAFMFLLNMVGALILIPALSCFLLPDRKLVAVPSEARSVGSKVMESARG